MKKFDLNEIGVHLILIICSFIFIRYMINTANDYPKGSPENLFGIILGLTLAFAVLVYIFAIFYFKKE